MSNSDDDSFVPEHQSESEEGFAKAKVNKTSKRGRASSKKGKSKRSKSKSQKKLAKIEVDKAVENFRAFVQDSPKKVRDENGNVVPSRVFSKKTRRNAGRAHTVVIFGGEEGESSIRCHETDVFRFSGNQFLLDTKSWPSRSTKESINIGLALIDPGLSLRQKNWEFLLERYDSETQRTTHIATVGSMTDGDYFCYDFVNNREVALPGNF